MPKKSKRRQSDSFSVIFNDENEMSKKHKRSSDTLGVLFDDYNKQKGLQKSVPDNSACEV